MKRGWFLLLALSMGLNGGLLYTHLHGRGQAPPEPPEPPPMIQPEFPKAMIDRHVERMSRHLQLDAPQREAFRRQAAKNMPAILALRREVQGIREALMNAHRDPQWNRSRIRELVARQSATQARLDSLVAEAMLAEAELLTPEQRQRYVRRLPWDQRPGRRGPSAAPR